MKLLLSRTVLVNAYLLMHCTLVYSQCDWQERPEKWLYNVGFYGFTKTEPESIKYASRKELFFDAFVFQAMYSFVRGEKDIYFYLFFSGPSSYTYDINETDSLAFYFFDKQEIKLAPLIKYYGKPDRLIAFYKMDTLFLQKMAFTEIDSITMNYTPVMKPREKEKEPNPLTKYTFKNFSKKHQRLFRENAICFKERFARKVKPK